MPCTWSWRAGVLAQEPDRDLGDRDGVEGVDAAFGVGRSVRLLAGVAGVEVADGEAGHAVELAGCRVHHEGGVDPVEAAPLEHEDLAAAALLSRSAEDADGDAQVVGERRQADSGADSSRRDHVVPAGVADLGEGVVLGADRHRERPAARPAGKGSRQPTDPRVEIEAPCAQRLGAPGGGELLLEGELGVGVDLAGELDEAFPGGADRGPRVGLRRR